MKPWLSSIFANSTLGLAVGPTSTRLPVCSRSYSGASGKRTSVHVVSIASAINGELFLGSSRYLAGGQLGDAALTPVKQRPAGKELETSRA